MVIYSNEIKDFLDKLYFYELTHRENVEFPLYNYYNNRLRNVDRLTNHTLSSTFPMSRDRLFGLIIGRLEFGYSYDGTNACIEYYINRDPQNDWFDLLIRESQKVKQESIIESDSNTSSKKEYSNEIRFGKWRCIVSGDYYTFAGKGKCRGLRMYLDTTSKRTPSYFLFQRQDNKRYFYCTIVPAPEKGPKETKFSVVPHLEVPSEILEDLDNPHH